MSFSEHPGVTIAFEWVKLKSNPSSTVCCGESQTCEVAAGEKANDLFNHQWLEKMGDSCSNKTILTSQCRERLL